MSYAPIDLASFEPLFDPARCEGTSYFELHPTELPHPHACWMKGSLLLSDAAFDFFAECFHRAHDSFDHFGFQRFGAGEVEALCEELSSFIKQVALNPTRDVLFSRYASLFTADIWSEVPTEVLVPAVSRCGERLLGFISTSTKESNCLWVLGV